MEHNNNWKEELLASATFNAKERNLLKNGAKSLTDSWYLGALYLRWKKLKGLHQKNTVENKGQLQSSFKELDK